MKIKERNIGIDIIKVIAVILVLSVHFFLNTNYYSIYSFGGISMKLQTIIRNFCMICVPLFIISTGFLNNKKEYNKSFFKSLFNIIIIWIFYSVIEYLILNWLNGNLFNIKDFIYSVTSFEGCGYSWYIEMYIGLYILSPILNNAFDNFNEKNKLYLLILSISSIILPEFLNSNKIIHFPNWWSLIYPIPYYICGKYILYTKPKIKKTNLILLIIFIQIFTTFYDYIASIKFNSFPVFISSTLIFLTFYDLNIKNIKLKKTISYISNISFDIYLSSSLIDKLIYPIFNSYLLKYNITQQKCILFAPILIIIIFILSFIYGSIRKLTIKVR